MKKQIPILFSTAMVQAILAGRKTVTRRTVTPMAKQKWLEPETLLLSASAYPCTIDGEQWAQFRHPDAGKEVDGMYINEDSPLTCIKCPYGQLGDVLYVRETYYQLGYWREVKGVKTKGGRMKWEFVPVDENVVFTEPYEYRKGRHHKDPYTVAWHKRLPRFMPKKYARTWLEVEAVEVQRLWQISEDDARAEGIEYYKELGRPRYKDYTADARGYGDPAVDYPTVGMPICSFSTLWESINGEGSWEANPWVWVVRFKVLSTTGKPEGI